MNKRFRSAITGRWVTRLFAKKNPATTVSESTGTTIIIDDGDGHDELPGTIQCQFCGKWTRTSDVCEWCGSMLNEGE